MICYNTKIPLECEKAKTSVKKEEEDEKVRLWTSQVEKMFVNE